ncbi:MAG TPA: histidine phosphatase family protein [Alphaproteobacteria bacterium]|nr:histidine phosphatase family protein [Alphaproteobacteria bacterium]
MTTTFFLLRHAAHDNVGSSLAGRRPGVHLSEAGRAQAERLGQRMRRERFVAIHTSPRERAQETAAPVAAAAAVDNVIVEAALDEVDFSGWTGKDFATLATDPAWRRWNAARSLARTPGGESMLDVRCRAMHLMERLAGLHAEAALVFVSHAEVIRAIVCHVLGLSSDAWNRFDIGPASISTVVAGDWGARVLTLNEAVA